MCGDHTDIAFPQVIDMDGGESLAQEILMFRGWMKIELFFEWF